MSEPESYAGIPENFPAWSSELAAGVDAIAALERLMAEDAKPVRAVRRPYFLLSYPEWQKASRGEPFVWMGILCRLGPGGWPEPATP